MHSEIPTDYETYREIMHDLMHPIAAEDLDLETHKRLYESKLVYLESLRTKCFQEMNKKNPGFFQMTDYELILGAIRETNSHLRRIIITALTCSLKSR